MAKSQPGKLFAARAPLVGNRKITHSSTGAQEIPYGLRHAITRWEAAPKPPAALQIECDVTVARAHLKAIVIGKGGSVVRRVVETASAEMEKRFQRRVSLRLRVKVKPHESR